MSIVFFINTLKLYICSTYLCSKLCLFSCHLYQIHLIVMFCLAMLFPCVFWWLHILVMLLQHLGEISWSHMTRIQIFFSFLRTKELCSENEFFFHFRSTSLIQMQTSRQIFTCLFCENLRLPITLPLTLLTDSNLLSIIWHSNMWRFCNHNQLLLVPS